MQHAQLCEEWAEVRREIRRVHLDNAREQRYDSIRQRLSDLGWGEEIAFHAPQLRQHKLVRQPKPLTDRIWFNIKEPLVKFLQEHKDNRLEIDRQSIIRERWFLASQEYNKYIEGLDPNSVFPSRLDIIGSEPFRSIIEGKSTQIEENVPSELFASAIGRIPELAAIWREEKDEELVQIMKAAQSDADHHDLNLATTLFAWDIQDFYSPPISYPRILMHSHATEHHWNHFDCDTKSETGLHCTLWNERKLVSFDETASARMRDILVVCGLDPDVTTKAELEEMEPFVECVTCAHPSKGKLIFRVPSAVVHCSVAHKKEIPTWRMLTSEEERKIRQLEHTRFNSMIENSKAFNLTTGSLMYCCNRCHRLQRSYSRSWRAHMKSAHVSRRDAILVLLGASCFYVFSIFTDSAAQSPSIIINTANSEGPEHHTITETVTATTTRISTATVHVSPVPTRAVDLGLVDDLPETSIIAHAAGWTLFRNLYMSRGTLLLLTTDESKFPPHRLMTSTGLPGNLTNDAQRIPTAQEMDFITPVEARRRWGGNIAKGERNRVLTVEGTTLLYNDPPQFLNHSDLWDLGLSLRAFSDGKEAKPSSAAADASFTLPLLSTTTPTIDRAIFIHSDAEGWRDGPGFNGYFMRAVFPSITIEVESDWMDRVNATRHTQTERAFHFPLALLTDRSAAFRDPICGWFTQRTAANAWMAMAKEGKIDLVGNWWASMRAAVIRYAGGDPQEDLSPTLKMPETIVITYINRQGTRRHLKEEDNRQLVQAIEELVARKNQEGGRQWEFHDVQAERLTLDEQIQMAAKTHIMLGVHGNGLTHLVMMKPTLVSAVVEMFLPEGYARDYEWTSRSLGMTHYSIWNDTVYTYPNEPPNPDYPEGFHGPNIPVQASVVANVIEEHVAAREKGDTGVERSPVYDQQ
ncbi:unnamed protein product [Mycena citricolor]|uniref:Glycosyltransferase 61 catalytic domain-containing protein n=1 Tax=Mycena citricolor TaxID=2018698 RepID=A0AAD2H5H0_9AGAR|nr:unnamed protein product [Mycena citricolor]